MLKLSLKNLTAHKRRLVGTFLAIVIGIGFFSGVNTLTATINQTFNDLFSNGNQGTDAFVRSSSKIEVDRGPGGFQQRGRIDESVAATVKGVDGVAEVQPFIQGIGRIVNAQGKALGNPTNGPPTFAESWIANPKLNGYSVADGRAPEADGEVVIDRGAAKEGKVKVGDKVTVQLSKTVSATVVGIVTYQGEDNAGGTTYAGFTLAQAERDVVGTPGKVDGVKVIANAGVGQDELVSRIDKVLPQGTEALTGKALVKELQDNIQKAFLSFFNIFLSIFAAIAVIVAVFSIYNTFSIIVTQRTREMALLRAIGASRAQVMRSVLLEALIIGVVASLIGVFFGVIVAIGLKAMLTAFGFGLPASSLVFGPGTVIGGVVVGTLVSVTSGLVPAIKSTRIPPIAALRDVAVERTKPSKVRIALGAVLTGVGMLSVISGAVGKGDNAVAAAGLGAVLTLIGVVVLGPVTAGPMSRLIGWPLPRLKGVTGQLARDNAMRNPRRTAGSAAALMIGVGIVSLFVVFAASIKSTIDSQIEKSFAGDLVVDSGMFGGGGITPQLRKDISAQPGIQDATGLRFGLLELAGQGKGVFVSDPKTLPGIIDIGVTQGSLADLGPNTIAIQQDAAKDHGWALGQMLPARFVDGATVDLKVAALYEKSDIVRNYVISLDTWLPHAQEDFDSLIAIKLKPGTSLKDAKAQLQPLVDKEAAGSKLQTRSEFRDAQAGQIDQLVYFVIVMLAVAIVISLMGIANTLSLSISERMRELGLLRAVGMVREQLRSTIRWESVIIALFGTLGGLALGLFFSWALVQAASSEGLTLTIPYVSLLAVVVVGAVAGIIAAALPARRAARLDVLAAIATD